MHNGTTQITELIKGNRLIVSNNETDHGKTLNNAIYRKKSSQKKDEYKHIVFNSEHDKEKVLNNETAQKREPGRAPVTISAISSGILPYNTWNSKPQFCLS